MRLARIGQQRSSYRIPDKVIDVWEAKNCFDDWAYVKLIRIGQTWLWAYKDASHRRDWLGFDTWTGVKSRLEEFYGGERKESY